MRQQLDEAAHSACCLDIEAKAPLRAMLQVMEVPLAGGLDVPTGRDFTGRDAFRVGQSDDVVV
jgi:hypothetical protein